MIAPFRLYLRGELKQPARLRSSGYLVFLRHCVPIAPKKTVGHQIGVIHQSGAFGCGKAIKARTNRSKLWQQRRWNLMCAWDKLAVLV